jgi:hypothetical protein
MVALEGGHAVLDGTRMPAARAQLP